MKIYDTKFCLLAMLLLSVAVGCSRQKTVKTSLEGQWTGYDVLPPNLKCQVTVTNNQLEFHGSQSNDWCRGVFVLDEKTQPMQMDFTIQEAPQNVGETVLAIFERQGDQLKIAISPPSASQRPADFTPGPTTRVMIYKRE